MTAKELRQKYLEFFKSKGHAIIPSASLIPENDPTVLFTTAGMHPLVPYLMGEKHPAGARLTDVQKCIRTSDIDEVGDATHHTFFEMLGNWSLGDYFKKETIKMSWEFLTSPEWLNLDKGRLAVSVFAGDPSTALGASVPFDEESFNIWKELGVSESRIAKLPRDNNWWGPAGQTGPCGPDTEIFYWVPSLSSGQAPDKFDDEDNRWVEIWNDVFLQYNKNAEGKYEKLSQQNVDTGMGLERTLSALNGLDDNYKTELFWPLIGKLEELSGKKYGESIEIKKAMRIIADHIKAASFISGDEKRITPSNVGAGYVLRRLIRRAVRNAFSLGIKENFTFEIAGEVVRIYKDTYPELEKNKEFIIHQLVKEENKFKETLEQGLKELNKMLLVGSVQKISSGAEIKEFNRVDAKKAFYIYQTYGFPLEMIQEELAGRALLVNEKEFKKEFEEEFKKHQELSRTASAGMFKGGLADASEATVKYHTAAHLMLAALKKILGEQVSQKGSNITPERLRFDFSYGQKMTPEQIKQVEDIVNEQIKNDLPVVCEEMDLEKAKESGATGVFDAKYGERVKVYHIGKEIYREPFSVEICGGPHAERTGALGKFKITKEEASSAGVRRIKAILE